ncbi:MAG: ATP-binding protein [Aggregatilineales bacterium]
MQNMFSKATKMQSKLKLALVGVSGSGKTWTALKIATEIAAKESGRIALIDTEGGAASKYASDFDFDVCDVSGDYNPKKYIAALNNAVFNDYAVLVIDSVSHAWSGKGGTLEIVDKSTKGNNSWSGWATGRPVQNSLVDAILGAQIHLIVTMRAKTAWETQINSKGKPVPVKIGTAPVQSADFEYEFDVVGYMNQEHAINISKSRCSDLDGLDEVLDADWLAKTLHSWVSDGDAPALPARDTWMNEQYVRDMLSEFSMINSEFPVYLEAVGVDPKTGTFGDSTLMPGAFRAAIVATHETLQRGEMPDPDAKSEFIDEIEDDIDPQQETFIQPENEYGTTSITPPTK